MGDVLDRALQRTEQGWQQLSLAVEALSDEAMELATSAGRTVKEMLAHVAFWDEAVVPVVTCMFRGQRIPPSDYFASGYQPGDSWPADYVHNAREAEWARGQSPDTVRERLIRAHELMVAAVRTMSDEEATERAGYLEEQPAHYEEHLAELQLAVGPF